LKWMFITTKLSRSSVPRAALQLHESRSSKVSAGLGVTAPNAHACASCKILFRWAVWLRLRSAVRERARQAAYYGPGTQGRRSILTSHLVHRLPRKQRTRALTRSNLAVYSIQTRLPDSIAKRECSAGSAEGPRSKRQRNVRPANDTSFRKVTTGKTTAWNCTSRQQVLRVEVPEAALSEPASVS
jgi:hypothetical protein